MKRLRAHSVLALAALSALVFACVGCSGQTDDPAAPTTAADAGMDAAAMADIADTHANPDTHTDADTVTDSDTVTVTDSATQSDTVTDPDAATAPDTAADIDDPDTAPIDAGPQPCNPPLKLEAPAKEILPFDLMTFIASGGTGAWRFELTTNASGAVLNKLTGAYLSGDKTGTKDGVQLTDEGCIGEANAEVSVVDPLSVAPLQATVGHGGGFTPKVSAGSGSYTFSLGSNGSGAVISSSSGLYKAGAKDGVDTIVVTDTGTGETATITVQVSKGAKVVATPPNVVAPVGSDVTLGAMGGSGHYTAKANGGVAVNKGPMKLLLAKAGASKVPVSDDFTGDTWQVGVRGRPGVEVTPGRFGDGYQMATVLAAGDLDKDGHADAVVAVPEADIKDNNGGAVLLYRGQKGGLKANPSQVIAGSGKDTRLGWSAALADVTGDKRPDLVIGAPLGDAGMSNNGVIHIHKGLKNGTFSAKTIRQLPGAWSSDQTGSSVVVCDFNGDGLPDIAAGAPYGEDRSANPIVHEQGAVRVWLGHPDGYLDKPDLSRYGRIPQADGSWKSIASMRIGWSLAAGDVDGDGACDLAVGSLHYKDKTGNDGVVLLYRGAKSDKQGIGGLDAHPVRVWSGAETGQVGSQFGRSLAMGDVDGDGKADLLVGQLSRRDTSKKQGLGAAWLFRPQPLGNKPATKVLGVADAAWSTTGAKPWNYAGYRVAMGDLDGDGLADLLVQHGNGEVTGGPSNTGIVAWHPGVKGKLPDKTAKQVWAGAKGGDYFGLSVAVLDDLDGDKKADLLVWAGLDDSLGFDLGRPWFVSTQKDAKAVGLQLPGQPSGARFGHHLRFVGDLNGDGYADLAVGAPHDPGKKSAAKDPPAYTGTRAGQVYLFAGNANGVANKPAWNGVGFAGLSSHDWTGWAVDSGDFDGDGLTDLMALARYEDRPGSFSANTYNKDTKCTGGSRNNVAGVHIFAGQKGQWPKAATSFVAYGPQKSQVADSIASGFDANGDGLDDLLLGGASWDAPDQKNAGGWALVYGRKATAKVTVVCEPDHVFLGLKANDNVGRSVVGLHDIDGDGCDEFAVGGNAEDLGKSNQGTVRVIYGWGDKCNAKTPREVVLTGGTGGAQAGWSVAAGSDVDGDKLPDLLVGAYNQVANGSATGAVTLVRGAYLKTLSPKPVQAGQVPSNLVPMVESGTGSQLSAKGATAAGQFGYAVALIPGFEKDGRAAILVGAPNSDVGGTPLTGGAELFRWHKVGAAKGLHVQPWLAFAGESPRPGSRFGQAVSATSQKGKPVFAVGAWLGTPHKSAQLDQGVVYAGVLPVN